MSTRLPKIISQEEAAALLAVPNVRCPTGLRNRVILEVMYRAGLRVSEVVKLKPGNIRRQTGEPLHKLMIENGNPHLQRVGHAGPVHLGQDIPHQVSFHVQVLHAR